MGKKMTKLFAAAGAVLATSLSTTTFGAILVDFKPDPSPNGVPEVKYDGTLQADIGATGNSSINTAGGLRIETPFELELPFAYAFSVQANPSAGTTAFLDVTMVLNDLSAAGDAIVTPLAPGVTLVSQVLTDGGFQLWSHDPDGDGELAKILLLEGTVTSASISGVSGLTNGAVLSGGVEYTGGIIYDALVAAEGDTTGQLSWSLVGITPAVGATNNQLNHFNANMTGVFDTSVVPEPASLSLLGLAGMGLIARRRR